MELVVVYSHHKPRTTQISNPNTQTSPDSCNVPVGIWDPDSWGQFIGGTHAYHGADRNFTDSSHVIGTMMKNIW